MNNAERANELKRLRGAFVQAPTLQERKDATFRAIGLLAFDQAGQFNAQQAADIFTSGRISQSLTNAMVNRFDLILAKAIAELEHPVEPPPIPDTNEIMRDDISLPLSNQQDLLWFWHHCHYTVKWKSLALAAAAAASLVGFGFWLGQQRIPSKIYDIFIDPHTQTAPSPIDTTKATAK